MWRSGFATAAGTRELGFSSVVLNAGTLVGTNLVSAGLGTLYWSIAARSFAVSEVGIVGAAVAATMLLGGLSVLGTGTLLVGELPRSSTVERSRLVVTAVTVSGLLGAVLGALFAIVAPVVSSDLRSFGTGLDRAAVIALTVSATAIGGVIDHALIGLLRGGLQLGRNALVAIVKLGALLVVAALPVQNAALALYATWLIGIVASFSVIVPLAGFGRLPAIAYRPQRDIVRRFGRSALQHHALNLALQVPGLLLPLLVTVLLSATANAYFYLASMIATFVYMIPVALSTTLYAVGAHQSSELASKARLTLALSLVGGICANVALLVAARPLLGLFGRAYADEVEWVLRVLVLGVFPATVKSHYVAVSQVKRRVSYAAMVISIAAVGELAGAALGATVAGLHGLTVAYVVALCIEAIVLAPTVLGTILSKRSV